MKKNVTLTEALSLLKSNFNWVSKKTDEITADDGTRLCIRTRYHKTNMHDAIVPAAQVGLSLVVGDRVAWSWGASDDLENKVIVNWYLDLRQEMNRIEDHNEEESVQRVLAKAGLK